MNGDAVVVGAPGASLRQKANGRPAKPGTLGPLKHLHGLPKMSKPWGYDTLGFNPRSKKDSVDGNAKGAVQERGASLAKHQCLAVNLITLLTRVMNFNSHSSSEPLPEVAPLPTAEALFTQADDSILGLLETQYAALYDAYMQQERSRTLPALSLLFGCAEQKVCVPKRSLRALYNNIKSENPTFPDFDMGSAGGGTKELFATMSSTHKYLQKLKHGQEQVEKMGSEEPISIEAARAAFLAGEATAAEERLLREAMGTASPGSEPSAEAQGQGGKSQANIKRRKSSARFFVWGECVVDMKEHEDEAADDVFMSDLAVDTGKQKKKPNKKKRISIIQDEVEPTQILDEQGVFHFGDFAVDTTEDSWNDYGYGGGGGGASAMDFAFGDFAIGVDEETLKKHEPQRFAKKNKIALDVPKKEPKPEGLTIVNYLIHYLVGHAVRVKCVAISPDEKHILSCSHEDVLVVLSDINTGKEMVSFSGHDDTLTSVAFSQDQKHVATTSRDQNLILWDAITAKVLLQFEHDKVVICCAWSKSGRLIVSGCQDKVCRVWDTKKGKERAAFTEHVAIIISLDFAPDDKHVVSASADKTVRIWSASNGQSVRVLKGHSGIVLGCRYLKDGKQILSNDENEIKLWDVKTGACKLSMHVENIQMALPIARQAKKRYTWTLCSSCPGDFANYIIASCNLRTVIIFDRSTGEEVLTVYTRAPVYCLASSVHDKIVLGDSVGNIYVITLQGI